MKQLTIPLQTEVAKYIREKMGWPQSFCDHYGEKFWNHYQASGWKLSSGNSIKDWKACFNAQWQQLKFKDDIELFNKMSGIPDPKTVHKSLVQPGIMPVTEVERLDYFIDQFRHRPSVIPFEDFGKWYEFMKGNKLLRPFTKGEVFQLQTVYKNDNGKCRCAVVYETLKEYINNGIKASDLLKLRATL